jgi:transaldolase/glucose-6-phosphate isomerase
MNPLQALADFGQSVWLDYIRRSLVEGGGLAREIEEDGLRGMTSNPAIFEKAIAGSAEYDEQIQALLRERDRDAMALYEEVALRDIRRAADVLRPVYDRTGRRDGYVSLEVSPYLARDTRGTIDEARRLWRAVGRENVMIKVPATPEGVPAIRDLIAEGINVNVTLLFAIEAYERVADAYQAGLEARAARGGTLGGIASVASFFVSRIDTAVDALLAKRPAAAGLAGKAAVANARLAYQRMKEILAAPRWRALAAKGAMPQRLLWASTGTKDARYRDVVYVEELIGADTVNTIPPATLDAFRDHGRPRASVEEGVAEARETLAALARADISFAAVTEKLLEDAVRLFADAFDKLLAAVEKKRRAILGAAANRMTSRLPEDLAAAVGASLEEWRRAGNVRRLWARDASLWTGADEARWVGWLELPWEEDRAAAHLDEVAALARAGGFAHVLLLGMGGSSLAPDVLARTFGRAAGFPALHVLDSTDPQQIAAAEAAVDLAKTLFIVSSKSGTTLEPNILEQYFLARATAAVGAEAAPSRFLAITDPGSKLEEVARAARFRAIFHGVASVGGRYSALSDFGLVPAAAAGVDVRRLIGAALGMARSCGPAVPPEENPGVQLGAILGTLAARGRDKVTISASPALRAFGAWAEQLLAESTGKRGRGLIPVDGEPLAAPAAYGRDRVFVHLALDGDADPGADAALAALEGAGEPVVRIALADRHGLAAEFFRWEIATATAGAILGVNPFDQPDVEASKIATRKLTAEVERTGALPPERPILEDRGLRVFADPANATALGPRRSLADVLRAHLARLGPGDYFALLAYLEMSEPHEAALAAIRLAVRDAKRVATCLGFGPRFLHSTGQAYKGGPGSGVFLQVTADDARDLGVPGQRLTFGAVKAAQARGDLEVLAERGRRALRVHLGKDVRAGLATLGEAVAEALRGG